MACRMELLQIPVICPNQEGYGSSLQPMLPFFKCQLYHQQLMVANAVITFIGGEIVGIECTVVYLIVWGLLGQHGCHSGVLHIDLHNKLPSRVWQGLEDRTRGEAALENRKDGLSISAPPKRHFGG